jgi:hypothetical protein
MHSWGKLGSLCHFVSCSTASSCSKRWPRWLDHVQNKAADYSEGQCQAKANRDIKSQTAHRGFLMYVIVCGLTYGDRVRRRFRRRGGVLAATPGVALEALAATLGVALEGLAARRSMARWSPLQSVLMPACGLHGGRYSGMSWRRVRESHPTIVGRRTIIWPIIAPSVLGRPHMMRHSRSPQQRRSTGLTGSTTACSSENPTRCRRGSYR